MGPLSRRFPGDAPTSIVVVAGAEINGTDPQLRALRV
jgi:hypothetical protein